MGKKPLHAMFTTVPPRYDLVNHVITLGMDRRWRKLTAAACVEENPARFLDVCCGTGDLALEVAGITSDDVEIFGLDYSSPMLDVARVKASERDKTERVDFRLGDVAELPFPDDHFDCIGISFAFRNITYKNPLTLQYLAEIHRVLRPSGRFVIVESSQPGSSFIRFFYRRYLRWFVAGMGKLLTSERGAYRYLATSAERYYTPVELAALLDAEGFTTVSFKPLFFGAAGICVVEKRTNVRCVRSDA